jgi:hypothetical protein
MGGGCMPNLIEGLFAVAVVFSAGILGLWWYAVVFNLKLLYYLMDKYPDRWDELNAIRIWGPGGIKPFKRLAYIYSNRDDEDSTIRSYKQKVRFGIRQALFMFIPLAVSIVLLVVVGITTG